MYGPIPMAIIEKLPSAPPVKRFANPRIGLRAKNDSKKA
jgi:hypothetical protein